MSLAYAQPAASLKTASGGSLQPFHVAAPAGSPCTTGASGLISHDDGEAENGYGWNASAGVADLAEKFTPPAYPANFTTACFSFITNAGVTTFPFTIVVYAADGTDGSPGTVLGTKDVVATPVSLAALPFTPTLEAFDISDLNLNIASGDVYIGAEWDASTAPAGVYISADESTSTPIAGGQAQTAAEPWQPTENIQPGYRALFVRAVAGLAGPGAPSVSKAFSPTFFAEGGTSTLTITLSNVSQPTDAAVLDAALTDTFPVGVVVAATPNASTTCVGGTVTAAAGDAAVTLSSGASIPAAGTCTITVDVTAANDGTYVNTIAAGSLQTQLGDNAGAANATLTVTPVSAGVFPPDEFFDEVTAPALPAGWISAASGGGSDWVTVSDVSDTPTNSAYATEVPEVSDITLDSPGFTPDANTTVSFKHQFNLESTFDGAVLEISIAGGAFTDIIDAGGSFVSGAYTGPISTNFDSPIAGRNAWNGSSGGFISTVVTLPASSAGVLTKLRFRTADDSSATASGAIGWWIDTIHLSSGVAPTEPVISVTPASLSFSVAADATDTADLTVANVGGGTLTFTISEAETAARAKPTSFLTSRAKMNSKAIVNGLQARPTGSLLRSSLAGSNRPHPKSVVLGDTEISQMDDNTPGDEGVSCGVAGSSIADNSWWRRFYFSEYPSVGATTGVSSVKISSGSMGGAGLPFTINLYTTPHSTAVDTIDTGALTLIGTATGTIDSGLQEVTVPVTGTVADTVGTDLVVEWHTDGSDSISFFPGANATPETHPSFLSSETCGLSDPTPATDIGFPDFHLTMVVGLGAGTPPTGGCDNPSDVAWLSVAPAAGSLASGASQVSTVTVNATGVAPGDYTANLCVASNDATTPLVTVPVALTVTAGANDLIFKDGFDGAGGGGEPGTFTDRTAFVAAIAAGYYDNGFDDAVSGPSPDLTYTQGGISYTVAASSSTADGGGLYNDTGIISTNLATDTIVVTFTGDPVTAVGGNVWATDIAVQATGTDITVTLSDGTTSTFTSTGPSDFLGFTTAAPITTMTIDAPDGADATPYWATLDNLIVGSAN